MRKLDQRVVQRAFTLIEEVIAKDPFSGKKLKGKYSGLLSYRFSDYRIIYTMIPENLVILTRFFMQQLSQVVPKLHSDILESPKLFLVLSL